MPGRLIKLLLPGEHFVGDQRHRVRTLLGSCVSIALWQPRLRIGAMSHFLLPASASGGEPHALSGRYGEDALALMLAELQALGVSPADCQAKVFGGGAMFEPDRPGRLVDVGRRNGEAARAMLQARRIPIVAESLFSTGHRQIEFSIRTGDVWVRHVPNHVELAA